MSLQLKEELKEKVLRFLSVQTGYDEDDGEQLSITNENNRWSILYGESIRTGIAGLGDSPEDAFDDFILTWNFFKGFDRVKKPKSLSGIA